MNSAVLEPMEDHIRLKEKYDDGEN